MKYTVPETAKAWVAFALAILTATWAVVADGNVELAETSAYAGALATAYGVFKTRNRKRPTP